MIDIHFGPQVCGDLTARRRTGSGWSPTARRLRDGHRRRAADPPLPRPAGGRWRNAGRPPGGTGQPGPGAAPCRRRAGPRSARTSGPPATSTRAASSCWNASTWSTGCPVALAGRRRGDRAGGGHGARPPGWRWCTGWSPVGPVELELGALLHLAGRARRAAGRRPAPQVEPVAGGAVVEGAYRLAGPGWAPAGGGGSARPPRGGRPGLTPDEDLWYAGRFAAVLAPRRHGVGAGLGRRARPEPPPATSRPRPRGATGGGGGGASRPTRSTATLARAADAFVVRTAAGRTWWPATPGSAPGPGTR